MGLTFPAHDLEQAQFRFSNDLVELQTEKRLQFIDLTELVEERVRRSRVTHGILNIHTRHTTTAIVVNENEPFLLEDLEERLDVWAPVADRYRHNDLEARRFQRLAPEERPNGDSHARAFLLGASETLNVVDGKLALGTYQRVFLVELDGPRPRTVSIVVLGLAA